MPALIAQPGMPIWIDLGTTNIEAAKKFYGAVLDWDFDHAEGENASYVIAKKDGMPVAGLAQIPAENSSIWGVMLYTPNVTDAHDKAIAAGASSVLAPQAIKNGGDMAIIVDPSGATIGLKRPADEIALFAAGEPSTPVWHELLVGNRWEETLEFYHTLAGWDIRTAPEGTGRYAVGEYEGAALVGLWDTSGMAVAAQTGSGASSDTASEEAKVTTISMWTVYMGVRNLPEAIDKALEQGGELVRAPWDSDFGRMATIQDAQGALLNLCEVEDYIPSEDEAHEPDLFAPDDFQAH